MLDKNLENVSSKSDLFRQLSELSPAPMLIADSDNTFQIINQSACALLGYDEKELKGINIREAIVPEQTNKLLHFLEEVSISPEKKAEFKFKKKDGGFIWCELQGKSLADGHSVITLADISTRKQMEEQLRISEERYHIITETAWDAIICLDENSQMIFVNHAAERIFGYKIEDLIGQSIGKIIPPELREKHFQGFNRYIKTGEKNLEWESLEISALRADGKVFPIEISLGEYRQDNNHYFIAIARDVSARRQIEKETAHLAAIVENSDDAIISKDLNGVITSWNKGAENLFGYTQSEAVGQPITMLIPPQFLNEEPQILSRIKSGEKIEHYETLRKRKNGKLVEISLTVSPIRDKKGKIIGASKIARNISQRKRIENELRESQMILALAMRSSRMGVWEHDLATDIVQWSPELEEIFGLKKGEFPQTRNAFYELIHEEDREKVFFEVECAVREKRDYIIEFRFYHTDGSIRWMEGRGQATYAQNGSPVRLYGSGIDITERKLAEEKIRESEVRFRMMADNISQLAWMADGKGWIFWYNKRWFEYTGTTLEEMQGWGWKKVHHPDYIDRVVKRVQWSWDTGEIWEDTFPLRSKEGEYRWFLSRALPLRDENGQVVLWFGTNTDITERKAAEEALLLANRSKDEFLSVLSHELRTPLNAILGWMRILKSGKLDNAKTERALRTIERNARLQSSLIEDLLDVSRIISGKMIIEESELDLVSTIESAVETVQPLAETKQVELRFFTEFHLLKIEGDQNRLEQIVLNLANNAIKFTPPGGTVTLKLTKTETTALLEIKDTGIGIKKEFLPHIFDRFRQADSTTQRNYSGLGLGLTIVKHLIQLHGGKISASSGGEGKGTKFLIHLPLLNGEKGETSFPAKRTKEELPPDQNSFIKDKKILLVDDDSDGVEPLQILLESHGAHVTYLESAGEALEIMAKRTFDLLISDIGMPEMDGYQLIKKIKNLNNRNPIPAIALTAYAGAGNRQQAVEAGFLFHLPKPVDYDLFMQTVKKALKSGNPED